MISAANIKTLITTTIAASQSPSQIPISKCAIIPETPIT